MPRVQLALNVADLDQAVQFYSKLFGSEPAKVRPGYANFAVANPPLKLVVIEDATQVPGSLNHLGVEVETTEEVANEKARLAEVGLLTAVEDQVTCCYALQVFDMAAARTGLRDHEATAGWDPLSVSFEADDHKAYYPGSHRICMRYTGDRRSGRLLGLQLFGHVHAEVAKRIDIAAAAIFSELSVDAMSDLDLSYSPPVGSPWDALQSGAQAWNHALAAESGAPGVTKG